ncbi:MULTISPECIES: polysaccharide deacetylase family protein [Campylobacter]|uniref:polysaccharide deacetylase family protein n=1 Tax=Campylobacter TaxID=194 RepID=UPI0014707917|nr:MULTISPECIES: polysaccharide deacetylase family protein [Campylobacter]MBN7289258.1 polysaccharide deacetylase family protein [Campylobacter curvus]MDU6827439.1 polysaccharide deacetylase family protein [Campylobacter sp.]
MIGTFCFLFPSANSISLMYHGVNDSEKSIFISRDIFENQLKYMHENNISVVGENDLNSGILENNVCMHLTFDDGYEDNFTTVFPLLQKYSFRATIFIATGFLGKEFKYGLSFISKSQLQEMARSNLITWGGHTITHPKLDLLSYKEQEKEIVGNKEELESLLSREIDVFAPPFGRYNENTIKILKKYNFKRSYVTKYGKLSLNNQYEIMRVPVMKSNANHFSLLNKDGYFKYKSFVSYVKGIR